MKKENKPKNQQNIIPELVSGSSTHDVTQRQQQASKALNQVQGLSNRDARRGFTLIELLVVVLIIAILAAIALPQYQKAITKAHMAKMRTMLEEVVRAGKLYYLRTGEYPTSFSDLDINLSLEHVGTPSCGSNLNHKKDAIGGEGFEISLADNSLTKYNYVSAYFTTGKYKCRGWVYYWKYPTKPVLENYTFCAEHYYKRACGSGCEAGILCNKIHGGWRYYDNSGLIFLF